MLADINTNYYQSNNNGNGNGIGTDAWIKMLKGHYEKLAATYQKKGMTREAEVFSDVVEEFAVLQKAIKTKEGSKKIKP